VQIDRPFRAAFGVSLLGLCLSLAASEAQGEDAIVLRVGAGTVSARELEKRLSALPRSELAALGTTDRERIQGFIERYLVPEYLLAEAARKRGILEDPSFRPQRNEVLRRTLESTLRAELEPTITKAEIQRYYATERRHFEKPEGILIWRILVDDPDLARRILDDAKGTGGPDRWRSLAREHSLDTATNMRGGTLGFVHADGKTDVPQLEVDPALYSAAASVKDGELVPKPITEGKHLAVVWRRGTRPARAIPLETVETRLSQVLLRQRLDSAIRLLIEKLRKDHVTNLNGERIEQIEYPLPSFTPKDALPNTAGSSGERKLEPPNPSARGLR
jgi:hypothetical protein